MNERTNERQNNTEQRRSPIQHTMIECAVCPFFSLALMVKKIKALSTEYVRKSKKLREMEKAQTKMQSQDHKFHSPVGWIDFKCH